jgi:hypothetical protein
MRRFGRASVIVCATRRVMYWLSMPWRTPTRINGVSAMMSSRPGIASWICPPLESREILELRRGGPPRVAVGGISVGESERWLPFAGDHFGRLRGIEIAIFCHDALVRTPGCDHPVPPAEIATGEYGPGGSGSCPDLRAIPARWQGGWAKRRTRRLGPEPCKGGRALVGRKAACGNRWGMRRLHRDLAALKSVRQPIIKSG